MNGVLELELILYYYIIHISTFVFDLFDTFNFISNYSLVVSVKLNTKGKAPKSCCEQGRPFFAGCDWTGEGSCESGAFFLNTYH